MCFITWSSPPTHIHTHTQPICTNNQFALHILCAPSRPMPYRTHSQPRTWYYMYIYNTRMWICKLFEFLFFAISWSSSTSLSSSSCWSCVLRGGLNNAFGRRLLASHRLHTHTHPHSSTHRRGAHMMSKFLGHDVYTHQSAQRRPTSIYKRRNAHIHSKVKCKYSRK